ncbi:MAG: hypothetical protein OEZ04_10860, partial [Nitrospinota bacterium]|nr:hypothetical protein [Nitrospinota bacterium]
MRIENTLFVKAIVEEGLLTDKSAAMISKGVQGHYGLLIHLINQGLMKREGAIKLWADSLGVAWVDLNESLFQTDIVQTLPKTVAAEKIAIPLYKLGDKATVAMADPTNRRVVEDIERAMKIG